MKRAAALCGALLLTAHPAAGQDSTEVVLRQARELYEGLNVERAVPLFRQVLSPEWPFPITVTQRSDAYKYLGAALVLAGKADSAERIFQAALVRDPFTDMNPREFTPAQLAAFDAARRRTFALALRPVTATRIDASTRNAAFTLVTTHAADLNVSIQPAGRSGEAIPVFAGENEGLRVVLWDGVASGGAFVAPGRYELIVRGSSRLTAARDSTRLFFDVAYQMPPLEDTLPDIPAALLLPERASGSGALREVAKGLGVAAAVMLAARGLQSASLGSGQSGGITVVAAAGLAAGLGGLIVRARHGRIEANIEANRTREEQRRAQNQAILRRNTERLAHTVLTITPAAGVAR